MKNLLRFAVVRITESMLQCRSVQNGSIYIILTVLMAVAVLLIPGWVAITVSMNRLVQQRVIYEQQRYLLEGLVHYGIYAYSHISPASNNEIKEYHIDNLLCGKDYINGLVTIKNNDATHTVKACLTKGTHPLGTMSCVIKGDQNSMIITAWHYRPD